MYTFKSVRLCGVVGKSRVIAACMAFSLLTVACDGETETILGFDVTGASIPRSEIHRGGPPPDGIPSIDRPQFTPAAEVNFLQDDDVVLGVVHGDDVRAYPLRILIWHEIVNDTVGGIPVAVTYCPLCGTAMLVGRKFGDRVLTFGVSGLLYNSDVLMFDRETRSLWSTYSGSPGRRFIRRPACIGPIRIESVRQRGLTAFGS